MSEDGNGAGVPGSFRYRLGELAGELRRLGIELSAARLERKDGEDRIIARIDQHDRCDQEHFGKIHDRLAEIEAEQRADDERAALVLRLETRDLEKRNSGRAALIALIVAILGGSMAGLVEIAGRRFGAG
jgi:hypothetical protein